MDRRISVQVLAEDPVLEAGLTALLRQRPELRLLAGEADAPAVVVVAADTVDEAGIRLLRSARRQEPSRLVFVAARIEDHHIQPAVECGVAGIVRRAEATTDRLVQVIGTVAAGRGHLPEDLVGRVMTRIGRAREPHRAFSFADFSEREVEVLRLVAEGCTSEEIALKANFSVRTVKKIVVTVLDRHHLRNRAHAVAFAMRKGLI
ncbi:response regulator transcription factor [Streptomyces sp. NPDC020799]|uniref:response regulator transcription factor n=1 Tax=Streptomyces sp. NPDC020799 TaxID=3365091 RepID=UPI00378FE30A